MSNIQQEILGHINWVWSKMLINSDFIFISKIFNENMNYKYLFEALKILTNEHRTYYNNDGSKIRWNTLV